jgi:DNA polymerase I-like protein with 3'-5' exonuclease and polymerase domains
VRQPDLFFDIDNEVDWNMPTEYPDLTGYKQIAVDLETYDPNLTTLGPGWARGDGYIVGVAVAAGDSSWYFPMRHQNGNNLDPKMTLRWLQKQMATPNIDKIMHNATYDLGWLRAEGVAVQGRVIDTMITGAVVDENRWSYSLNNLGKDYVDMRKDEKLLRAASKEWGFDAKSEMWRLPARYVGGYAEQDAVLTLKLWERLRIELDQQDLWNIWNLETRLIPLMVEMRSRGVPVLVDKAEQTKFVLQKRTKDLRATIKAASGVDVDPWANASVEKMFNALSLEFPRTEAGAPSFTKQFLQAHPHPVCQALVRLREFDKADSTFIDTILRHAHKGRIHCEFHQLRSDDGGTVTGRFCVSADTLIETQRGPVPIVDVRPRQDLALTHLGRFQCIRHLIYKGEEEMVALRVSSGTVLKCTRNHRVLTASGWKRVGELTVGQEITGVDFKTGLGEYGVMPTGSGPVFVGEKAYGKRSGCGDVRQFSHSAGNVAARHSGRGIKEREGVEVFSLQDWVTKPDERQDREYAPQPQGTAVLRPERVRSCAEAGLVHWEADVEACLRASGGNGSDAWFNRGSGEHGGSSHRRGPSQQQFKQSGFGDTGSASFFTRSVTVEEIEPLGVAQVWDIEVETDHSYVAHGLIHHNSSSNPNLQQIPARDPEIKAMIRGLFVPEQGCKWGSFDYSSQEPRLLVHWAASLPDSVRHPMVDEIVHQYNTGDVDLHQMVADIAGIKRKEAKVVNLGIMYGMGKAKLAAQLDISLEEASELLDTHHSKVPFVKGIAEIASQQAEKYGSIRTLLGRRCRFPLWEPRGFGYKKPLPLEEARKEYGLNLRRAFTYKALNKLIQGSAADQNKQAMADCMDVGLIPMLTVHDELCFSVEDQRQAAQITEIMEKGLSHVLKVPSKVDVALTDNWGEVE